MAFQVLDVDLVLCEALHEGEEVYVEYGAGPTPFRVRCTLQGGASTCQGHACQLRQQRVLEIGLGGGGGGP
jgi:hypothetical protein